MGMNSTSDKDHVDFADLPQNVLTWIDCNNNDTIIVIWNQENEIVFVSKSVELLLGYNVEELMGNAWFSTVPLETILLYEDFRDAVKKSINPVNIKVKNKAGNYCWFNCYVDKIYYEKDDHDETVFISKLTDITKIREIEAQIAHAEKMNIAVQFAAGVVHEIRNPLTSLKGFLQLSQAGIEQKDEYYQIMIDEIDKIEAFTSELLAIAKPNTYDKKLESIEQMVKEVIVLLKSQSNLKNIVFDLDLQANQMIYCSRSQIKQVLINIIKNAIESMEMSGTIQVISRQVNDSIEVSIVDEGPGIPEDIFHKIDEPFFTTKNTGTGLGLMVTKQILEHHQASLTFFSNCDKGSTFRLIFPAPDSSIINS